MTTKYPHGSPKTNVNRLLRLAGFLRGLGRKDFNMRRWAKAKNPDACELAIRNHKPIHCQTACCVAGWATLFHPDLHMVNVVVDGDHRGHVVLRDDSQVWGHAAFAGAFGVDEDSAARLCSVCAPHQTPKAAAKAVEKVASELAKQHGLEIVEVLA